MQPHLLQARPKLTRLACEGGGIEHLRHYVNDGEHISGIWWFLWPLNVTLAPIVNAQRSDDTELNIYDKKKKRVRTS